ncbi:gliding motility-associated C-terminal domain-containing protein [Zobellia amurskyensis]|uniref:Gliding motility-associated C-terminal domain-containing protein n=1 Tax=Zobellia amurskyensis TaxID=248905 RepID=A0A7X3D3Z4_9FLAO|nr:choice-of-anchor L domain-containing protein [Zobellia amurskyensis]MUH37866.1 gliding motility-associated C-terminal domain-containing protein [Zobellia amurskyensis]
MKILGFLLVLLSSYGLLGQISVDVANYSVEKLVKDVLINSNCAETANYTSATGTTEGLNGIGYFEANGSDFPYEEGIVLSTGQAKFAEGPNDDIHDAGSKEWVGDADLKAITGSDILFNASYIQFDFVPHTNHISFNFLFASEEYQENFQCTFGDVFAFILTDSNGVSTNLAIIPNSKLPVSVTTIRPGVEGECVGRNLPYFDKINGDDSAISFHGQTTSLTAESPVVPGDSYTIKLVIADNRDSQVDSAVFLEAGSFNLGYDLGEDRTVANGNPACITETIALDATVGGVVDYKWYKDNVEIIGWSGISKVDVVDSGEYRVELVFSESCVASGTLSAEFIPAPVIVQAPDPLVFCDVDGSAGEIVNLTVNDESILGGQDSVIYGVTYYLSSEDAAAFENAIENPEAFELKNASETIYARISSGNSCYEITPFEVKLLGLDFQSELQEEYILCVDAIGKTIDPLPLLNTGLSIADYEFTWYKESISPENEIVGATDASYSANEEGAYIINLKNRELGCSFSLSTQVVTSHQPNVFEVAFVSDPFTDNNTIDIIAEGDGTYLYSVDDANFSSENRFENLTAGEHTAYVTDIYNCSTLSEEFVVVDFPRFFTPNGDGVNDVWSIVGFPQIEDADVSIYNQYGMLLHQLNGNIGWDGTFNGKIAPSSDYWFRVDYTKDGERKEFKSHFSLKR